MTVGFDATYYLLQNPDVAAAVVKGQFASAYDHYVRFGAKELRNPNADFNALEYAALNPDVAAAVASGMFASVWDHYVQFGLAEGRAPNASLVGFDAAGYLAVNADVAQAVQAGVFKSALEHYLAHGKAEGRTWGNETQLTSGTDKLVANKFVAGLVYNPGGTDRINALQDEDELTGIGTNPTLTATLGNSNDNGASTITPILKGIQTVNVAFTGSGGGAVDTLDLQDAEGLTGAVNISRITTNLDVAIRNMASVPAELSVSNTNNPAGSIAFTFLDSATAGSADSTRLTLSNVQASNITVQSQSGDTGVETITLATAGSAANKLEKLEAKDLVTLNITGSQNLSLETIKTQDEGKFVAIDGSTATGNLTLSLDDDLKGHMEATAGSGTAVNFSLKTGSGNDTLNVTAYEAGQTADTIALGAGTDTVAFSGGNGTFTSKDTATFTGVEAITVTRTGAEDNAVLTVDLSRLASDAGTDQTIRLTNAGTAEEVTFELTNLTAGEAGQITLTHSSSGQNGIDNTTVAASLADASGASDTVALTIVDGRNADARFNFTLTAGGTDDKTRVENVTLVDNDTENNSVNLTNNQEHTGTITLKGGVAGQFLNLDRENVLGLQTNGSASTDGKNTTNNATDNDGALVASVIDAESYAGNVIVRVSSSVASVSTDGAQTIKMGAGDDIVIFDNLNDSRAGLTISDTVSGGAGKDTLAIGGNQDIALGASEWTNVSGFETIRLLGLNNVATDDYTYTLSLTDGLITRNAADGKIINIVNDASIGTDGEGTELLSRAIIDARSLSVGLNFNYNGEEGAKRTDDRFIFSDAQINSTAVIDGGATSTDKTLYASNNDVLEVRNAAVVSTGDLQNIKNVGVIELTNDQASVQTFTVQLNDDIVDAMANSYHKSTAEEAETLTVKAIDNTTLSTAHSVLRLEAGSLTARSNVSVEGGAGNDTISLGAGSDTVKSGAGVDTISLGGGADQVHVSVAAANGADRKIITGFGADDVLNFSVASLTGTNDFADASSLQAHTAAGAVTLAAATELLVVTSGGIADISALTALNGTDLLAAIGGNLTGVAGSQNDFLVAVAINGGGTALYYASSTDDAIAADEITLVGVLDTAIGSLTYSNFTNSGL